jgi:hypothetical protein
MIPLPRRRRKEQTKPWRTAYGAAVLAACGAVLIGQMFWVSKNQHRFLPFAIERIKCDECKGNGLMSTVDSEGFKRLRLCDACFGLGVHQIRRVDSHDVLCPACVGFGRVEDEEGAGWRWCRRCQGRGLIRDADAPPPYYQPAVPIFGTETSTNAEPPAVNGEEGTSNAEHPPSNPEDHAH